jgi:hypothetical protein
MQREYGQDRAWLTLSLDANLQSVFHWNTKQVLHSCTLLVQAPLHPHMLMRMPTLPPATYHDPYYTGHQ